MVNKGIVVSIIAVLVVVVGLLLIFSTTFVPTDRDIDTLVSVVTIPEGASLADSGKNFEPETIKVVIGTNNTVRWTNSDSVPSSVVANDDGDPSFFNATQDTSGNPTVQSRLLPGESFEFTFRETGIFEYHSVPHPHMRGTVVVVDLQ